MPPEGRPKEPLNEDSARQLIAALEATSGIVCAVGAGGKKTVLHRLAEAHVRLGTAPIAMIAAVQMAPPPGELDFAGLIAPADEIEAALDELPSPRPPRLLLAAPPNKPMRFAGLPADVIARLHDKGGFEVSLVKADGARMRAIKAPAANEPVIPDGTRVVLPVLSLAALGRPLDPTFAHRPERLATLLDLAPGTAFQAAHLAALLASPEGALKRTEGLCVVPILNAVDTDQRLEAAREIARLALEQSERFERVVLTSMLAADPIVEIVRRPGT